MASEPKSPALQTNMDVDYVLLYRYTKIGKDYLFLYRMQMLTFNQTSSKLRKSSMP